MENKYKVLKMFGDFKKGKVLDPKDGYEGTEEDLTQAVEDGFLEVVVAKEDVVDVLAKESASIPATGEYVVKQVAEGKFRLYNEKGQAVSHVCSGTEDILKINKACSRANALRGARTIK